MVTYSRKETPFNWTCSVCNQPTTITSNDYHHNVEDLYHESSDGHFMIAYEEIDCPNPECEKTNISVALINRVEGVNTVGQRTFTYTMFKSWQLIPSSTAKTLHEDVPKAVVNDYTEGAEILDRSPKASATLARRALQGIIRDYFGIEPNRKDPKTGQIHKKRLADEIEEIKGRVDPIVWQAIDAVRSVGAIGAHMEEDVNLIIDVTPSEAKALLGLIEFLSKEWYQKRAQQITDVLEVAKIAKNKKLQQLAQKKLGNITH